MEESQFDEILEKGEVLLLCSYFLHWASWRKLTVHSRQRNLITTVVRLEMMIVWTLGVSAKEILSLLALEYAPDVAVDVGRVQEQSAARLSTTSSNARTRRTPIITNIGMISCCIRIE